MATKTRTPGIQAAEITNFSGGPNFRDAPTELAAVEAYDAFNCTFDERGGVQSRLGFQKRNLTPLGNGYKVTVLSAGPALYWRLDEGVGAATAADSSGNGNTGAYLAGVTLGQPGLLVGDTDAAALFNNTATAGVVAGAYQPFAAGSSRTFIGWARRVATTDADVLFGSASPGPGPGSPRLIIGTGSNDVLLVTGTGAQVSWAAAWPGINQTVFWALTYNDATQTAELFINGVSKGTRAPGAYTASATGATFAAGIYTITGAFGAAMNGALDEIAVFPSILPAATITAIYNAGLGAANDFIVNEHYSALLNLTITQCGKSLFKADSTTIVKTFTTADVVTFTEIAGVVVACHPIDGLWTSPDGTTWTKITAANAPTTGTLCVAAWQGRLFVGLTDGTVHWSDLGTLATWTNTNFVAVWDKDQQPVIALAAGSGQDIQGRPGLLVFKTDSVYRINNPTTGAFTTISSSIGAAGPKAVVGVGARVCWIGKHGIFWWREDQAAPVNASDLLRPAWRLEALSYANQAGWAAGRRLDRAYFSCSSVNSNVNDLAFEFHPDDGWIAPRSDAMSCYSTSKGPTEQTFGGSPTAPGQLYQLDTGGTDDGQNITGWFQTRWLIPNDGFQAQVWQVRLHGRGLGTMTFRQDYEDEGGSAFPFDFAQGGFLYDNGVLYDAGNDYAIVTLASSESFDGVGTCRQFALRFDFAVDSTAQGRSLPGNLPAPQIGAFGLYGAECLYIPLGLS